MNDLKDLEVLLNSSVPIIIIKSSEERRLLEIVQRMLINFPKNFFTWKVTEGLQRIDEDMPPQMHNTKPVEVLSQIKATKKPGVYILLDFHPFLDEPTHVRLLKDIAISHAESGHTLILISHDLTIPEELERFTAEYTLSVPDQSTLENLIRDEARVYSEKNKNAKISADKQILTQIIESLSGLPLSDARKLIRRAIHDDGVLTESDNTQIMQAKFDLLGQGGVLSFEYDTAQFAEIGGLERLKEWLHVRRSIFTGESSNPVLDPPKGIMLLGVQGCGKSLAAKAVAGSWLVPLLRLDAGALFNKFYGETEKNLTKTLATAEIMEPCVMWIDEIEKVISTEQHDGGTSQRVLGTLLTWMAENSKRVFIVATSNNIESLPPELVRKGRLDEIFFVDLPDIATRKKIFEIHLTKRKLDAENIQLVSLVEASEGFSGAEIEQVVVSALYTSHAQDTPVSEGHLLEEIKKTRPLSIVMTEKISRLRDWARDRTVPAN
jgi:SpoVK/Ycf46/Vps4 family AAA+-type ATPase